MRELCGNHDYSEAGRVRNIRAGQRLARRLSGEGVTVAASFVSPYLSLREEFKSEGGVVEIFVHTTEIRGKEARFAANFELPARNYIDIDTTNRTVQSCIGRILPVAS